MTEEKRRFSRVFFNVDAMFEVDDGKYPVDHIVNLSVGGCLLELEAAFAVKQKCQVTIQLNHMAPGVKIYGEIVRVGDGDVSVKFTSISPDNLLHLQNIIRYNAEDPDQIEAEINASPGLK